VDVAGDLAGLGGLERRELPKRQPALLGADGVLVDPCFRSAFAQSQSKAGEGVIEGDSLLLALEVELGDGGFGQFHSWSPGRVWED
jgi:hypothetical protein